MKFWIPFKKVVAGLGVTVLGLIFDLEKVLVYLEVMVRPAQLRGLSILKCMILFF